MLVSGLTVREQGPQNRESLLTASIVIFQSWRIDEDHRSGRRHRVGRRGLQVSLHLGLSSLPMLTRAT